MEMNALERYRNTIKNWWVSLLLGIFFIVVGVVVFCNPLESYLTLALLFGIMVLASGIRELYLGITTPAHSGKGWMIASGIIEIMLGVLLLVWPAITIAILPLIVGFWLMFRSFTMIGLASDVMGTGIKGGGWILAFAILALLASFFIIFYPVVGMGMIVLFTGIALLSVGIADIVFAFRLRSWKKTLGI